MKFGRVESVQLAASRRHAEQAMKQASASPGLISRTSAFGDRPHLNTQFITDLGGSQVSESSTATRCLPQVYKWDARCHGVLAMRKPQLLKHMLCFALHTLLHTPKAQPRISDALGMFSYTDSPCLSSSDTSATNHKPASRPLPTTPHSHVSPPTLEPITCSQKQCKCECGCKKSVRRTDTVYCESCLFHCQPQ